MRHRHHADDLRREVDVHRAMAEDDLRASGDTPDTAHARAARQLGNTVAAREAARGVWIAPWLESVWQDVRYGARVLRQHPGFAATTLATLTLGVGINLTLFAVVNALLLRPWPLPDAHRLVLGYHRIDTRLVGVSAPELTFLREHATSVDMAGTREVLGPVVDGSATHNVMGRLVSGNYFRVLDVPLAAGRGLQPEDDVPGRATVVVLGHDLWATSFSSDPRVVGRTIRFLDVPVTVVGVAGPGVRESALSRPPDIWVPLASMATLFPDVPFAREFLSSATSCCVDLVGRLRPGVARARAEAEVSALDRRFRQDDERDSLGMRLTGTDLASNPEVAELLPVFALLVAAALLVLLLACANVGNVQLARAAARRREITIRLAIGAARRRIVRQLLTEGLVLAVAATALCLGASAIAARAAMARLDASVARMLDFSIDGRMLLFATGVAIVACVVTSVAPAVRGTAHLVAGRSVERTSVRLRSTFLAAQIAISVVLLSAAALLGRGIVKAASQDVGFRLGTLMALDVERPPQHGRANDGVLREVIAAIGSRPIAAAELTPLDNSRMYTGVRRAGAPREADLEVRFHAVSSNYFTVLGIPLRAGRTFRDGATNEVVLNETLARRLWPDGDAVGGHLAGPDGSVGREIVGVVADAHIDDLGDVGPTLFQPARTLKYLLFNAGDVPSEAVRAIAIAVDKDATTTVRAIADNVGPSLRGAKLGVRIAGGVGVLALAIAAVGIAGVFSIAVTERTQEVGIRLALGASRRRVRALLLRQIRGPLVVGGAIGLLLAALGSQVLRGYLHGLSPLDPVSYAAVIVVVVLTAWTSTVVPMRRALRIDPATTLRHE
ncbi:MAG TPA: ABC transporter permease [Vicinamibacterales bacterium]|nr:ABC transporter permease [Vicinamibacterales bacterium]